MPVSKAKLARLKSEVQFRDWVATCRFIECLTLEQLRFFVEHGYVEGQVTRLRRSKFDGLSRKALVTLWREDDRLMARLRGRSKDEKRFYLRNGYFPDEAGKHPYSNRRTMTP